MDEIGAYFKEKLNKADFKIRNLENQTRRIRNEFDKLTEREKSISVREDAPDYVFQVDCYEKNLDSEELTKIKNRKDELEKELSELNEELQEKKIMSKDIDIYTSCPWISIIKVLNRMSTISLNLFYSLWTAI